MDKNLASVIGHNIRKYRERAGLTQGQLAERISVSTAFISRIECGTKLMKLERLYAAANVLNVSCGALFYHEEDDAITENIRELLDGKSPEFVSGIERIIRVCAEEFEAKET